MATLSLRAYYREIEGMIERGRVKEAVTHCRHILKSFPKSIDTYRLLGKAFLEQQRYTEGSDVLQRVLSAVPDDFVSQVGMSMIREDEGNLDAAIWHMERAFEAQPSNAAVQDELRRLYGRRDGVQPAKIRLTRGALVRMYARGDLFQQAIAEAKMALVEQPDRVDLEIILARMFYLSNQKVSAAEVCSRLVEKLPFCLEANRILSEILPGTARDDEAQIYLQRVYELDPYMGHVAPGSPNSAEAAEEAVMLDYLEEPGEDEGEGKPDWAQNAGVQWDHEEEKLPDWMVSLSTTPEQPDVLSQIIEHEEMEAEKSVRQSSISPVDALANEDHEIPDWMKEAGWQPSHGDSEEPAEISEDTVESLAAETEIPEWLLAIAPAEDINGSPEDISPPESEEDTRWLESILTTNESEPPAEEELMSEVDLEPGSEIQDLNRESLVMDETPDIPLPLEEIEEVDLSNQSEKVEDLATVFENENVESEIPDWLAGLATIENEVGDASTPVEIPSDTSWLKEYESTEEPIGALESEDQLNWSESEVFNPKPASEESPEFLNEELASSLSPFSENVEPEPKTTEDFLAEMEQKIPVEQDATQPTKPPLTIHAEDREEVPFGEKLEIPEELDHLEEPEDLGAEVPEMLQQAAVFDENIDLDEIGKSNSVFSEILPEAVDKMGFTEDENMDIPDWLKESLDKDFDQLQLAADKESAEIDEISDVISPENAEAALIEDSLVNEVPRAVDEQTDQEGDASFAWLEALAARQGVDEETLATAPDERIEDLPDWIKEEAADYPPEISDEGLIENLELDVDIPSETADTAVTPDVGDITPQVISIEELTPSEHFESLDEKEFIEESPESDVDSQKYEDDFVLPDWLAEEQPEGESEEEDSFEPPIRKDFEWITEDVVAEQPTDIVESEPELEQPLSDSLILKNVSTDEPGDTPQREIDEFEFFEEAIESEETHTTESVPDHQIPEDDSTVPEPLELVEEKTEEVPDWLMALADDQIPPVESVTEDVLPDEFLEKMELEPEIVEPVSEPIVSETLAEETWFAATEPAVTEPSLEDTSPVRIPQPMPDTPSSDGSDLYNAQAALQAQDVDKALTIYNTLIDRGESLEDIIHDLRESLDGFPVDVSIWQSLGDAYMRNNQLQEALDAYTKAEELLR